MALYKSILSQAVWSPGCPHGSNINPSQSVGYEGKRALVLKGTRGSAWPRLSLIHSDRQTDRPKSLAKLPSRLPFSTVVSCIVFSLYLCVVRRIHLQVSLFTSSLRMRYITSYIAKRITSPIAARLTPSIQRCLENQMGTYYGQSFFSFFPSSSHKCVRSWKCPVIFDWLCWVKSANCGNLKFLG